MPAAPPYWGGTLPSYHGPLLSVNSFFAFLPTFFPLPVPAPKGLNRRAAGGSGGRPGATAVSYYQSTAPLSTLFLFLLFLFLFSDHDPLISSAPTGENMRSQLLPAPSPPDPAAPLPRTAVACGSRGPGLSFPGQDFSFLFYNM